MKICVGATLPLPGEPINAGITSTCIRVSNAIKKNYPNVSIEFISHTMKNLKESFTGNYEGFLVHYIPSQRPQIGPKWVRDWKTVKDKILEQDYDIVWSNSTASAFGGINAKKKTIYTVHGIIWQERKFYSYIYFFRERVEKNLQEFFLPMIFRNVDGVIAISEYNRVHTLKHGLSHPRFISVDTPIDYIYFEQSSIKEAATPLILCVGTISSRKNQLSLAKACRIIKRKLKEFKIIFAGRCASSGYYAEIVNEIKRGELEKNVEFLRPTDKELKDLYHRAWVFCLPSFDESLGLPVVEAMASYKPVVVSNTSGLPYTTENGKCGYLVDPTNPSEIANAIIRLIKSEELRKKFGMEGRKIAERRFHPDIAAKKYMKFFEETLCL
ncbi:MAG: glycosyltransferase family 4 protein [Thermoplasmata archaeon]